MNRSFVPMAMVSLLAGAACAGRVDSLPLPGDAALATPEGKPAPPLAALDAGRPSLAEELDAGRLSPVEKADAEEPSTSTPPDGVALNPSTLVEVSGDSGVSCVPWVEAFDAPFVADANPVDLPLTEAIARVTQAMIGSWVGRAVPPTYWHDPQGWDVMLTFSDDGGYSARAFEAGEQVPAFYYGSNLQCSLQRWRLRSVNVDGMDGEIDIAFQYPPDDCYLPSWQGELIRVVLDAGANRLRFEFRRSDGYGPIRYDLWRMCRRKA